MLPGITVVHLAYVQFTALKRALYHDIHDTPLLLIVIAVLETSPCGATPIIRVVSRYHLTKQCRVIESADSEYRPVPVVSALAANCTSCLEVDSPEG